MHELVDAVNAALKRFAPEYVTDPAQSGLPLLPRHALQQGQDAVQGPHRRQLPPSRLGRGQRRRRILLPVSHKDVGDRRRHLHARRPRRCCAVRTHIAEHPCASSRTLKAPRVKRLFGEHARRAAIARAQRLRAGPSGRGPAPPQAVSALHGAAARLATTPELYGEIVKRFRAMTPFHGVSERPAEAAKESHRSAGAVPVAGYFFAGIVQK